MTDDSEGGSEHLIQHLALIQRVCNAVCYRHGIHDHDAEDFCHDVILHIQEKGVLEKHRGGSLEAYLRTVVEHLYLDMRNRVRGKWRASAWAKRHGEAAVLLERLVYRDGATLEEAIEEVAARDDISLTRDEIATLAREMPMRKERPIVTDAPVDTQAGSTDAEDRVQRDERDKKADLVREKLKQALGMIDSVDALIFRLRYEHGLQVAEIARRLGLEQKLQYPRCKRIQGQLAEILEKLGVSRDDIRDLLDGS